MSRKNANSFYIPPKIKNSGSEGGGIYILPLNKIVYLLVNQRTSCSTLPLDIYKCVLNFIPDWEDRLELAATSRVIRAQCKRALLSNKAILLQGDNFSALYYRTPVHVVLPPYFTDTYMLKSIVLYAKQLEIIRITYNANKRHRKKIALNFFIAVDTGGNKKFKLLIPKQDKLLWEETVKYSIVVPKIYNDIDYICYENKIN